MTTLLQRGWNTQLGLRSNPNILLKTEALDEKPRLNSALVLSVPIVFARHSWVRSRNAPVQDGGAQG